MQSHDDQQKVKTEEKKPSQEEQGLQAPEEQMLAMWNAFTNTFNPQEKKIVRVASLDVLRPKK